MYRERDILQVKQILRVEALRFSHIIMLHLVLFAVNVIHFEMGVTVDNVTW